MPVTSGAVEVEAAGVDQAVGVLQLAAEADGQVVVVGALPAGRCGPG